MSNSEHLKIGTRGSQLALWQAEHVKQLLAEQGVLAEIHTISTQGDKDRSSPFSAMSGSAFFTKAIEDALLAKEVDIAVHSHKDLETTDTPGTLIAAIPERASPNDLLLVHPEHYKPHPLLPIETDGTLGTSSPRRQEQAKMFRPDLEVKELRGNVPTRLQKLRDGEYSAILLAEAGIARLGIDVSDLKRFSLSPDRFIPAAAQGALAIQIRADDVATREAIAFLHHPPTALSCKIERGILKRFRGGCQLPFGAFCKEEKESFRVWSMVLPEDGKVPRRVEMSFDKAEKGIEEKVHQTLLSEEKRKVFISKDLKKEHWWMRTLRENGHEAIAQSLIEQERIPIEAEGAPSYEALFFSSRNGVRYFLEQIPEERVKEAWVGVYGDGSAEELMKHGIEPDLVGSGQPTEVAEQLCDAGKGKKLSNFLMPGPEEAASTIPEYLQEKGFSVQRLPVYRTRKKKGVELPDELDTLIFTSPSNVMAYAAAGSSITEEEVLTIGITTEQAVRKAFPGAKVKSTSTPGTIGLMDLFFSSLNEAS